MALEYIYLSYFVYWSVYFKDQSYFFTCWKGLKNITICWSDNLLKTILSAKSHAYNRLYLALSTDDKAPFGVMLNHVLAGVGARNL